MLAAHHGVSEHWLRLVSTGILDDPAFVRALRKAAASPRLWDLVAPTAQDALLIPTLTIEQLGGSRDDLLGMLLESIETLRHPANRNFARDHSPLEHLSLSLDIELQAQRDLEMARGRINLESTHTARAARDRKAHDRARRWQAEVEARRPGTSKASSCATIGRREHLTADAVKKAIARLSQDITPNRK